MELFKLQFQNQILMFENAPILTKLKPAYFHFILEVVVHFSENGILHLYSNFAIHHVHTNGQ